MKRGTATKKEWCSNVLYSFFAFLKLTACLEASERGRIAMGKIRVGVRVSKCGFRTETWTGSAETVPREVFFPYTWMSIRGLWDRSLLLWRTTRSMDEHVRLFDHQRRSISILDSQTVKWKLWNSSQIWCFFLNEFRSMVSPLIILFF